MQILQKGKFTLKESTKITDDVEIAYSYNYGTEVIATLKSTTYTSADWILRKGHEASSATEVKRGTGIPISFGHASLSLGQDLTENIDGEFYFLVVEFKNATSSKKFTKQFKVIGPAGPNEITSLMLNFTYSSAAYGASAGALTKAILNQAKKDNKISIYVGGALISVNDLDGFSLILEDSNGVAVDGDCVPNVGEYIVTVDLSRLDSKYTLSENNIVKGKFTLKEKTQSTDVSISNEYSYGEEIIATLKSDTYTSADWNLSKGTSVVSATIVKSGQSVMLDEGQASLLLGNDLKANLGDDKYFLTVVFDGTKTIIKQFLVTSGYSLVNANLTDPEGSNFIHTYTGYNITQSINVEIDGRFLVEGIDYAISEGTITAVNVGTYTVTLIGKGAYYGKKTFSWSIKDEGEREVYVTFDYNDGSGSTRRRYMRDYYSEMPVPTREGYTFTGWYTEAKYGTKVENGDPFVYPDDHILYAHWDPIEYIVSFNSNGGTGKMKTIFCKYDEEFDLPENTFKHGSDYKFKEWNTQANGRGETYADGATIKNLTFESGEEVVLYAQWSESGYVVTFDANGGTVDVESMEFAYKYSNLPIPEREGYLFKGWYSAKKEGTKVTNGKALVTMKNHTLYARWTAIKYTVIFNANGGTGKTGDKTCVYDKMYILSKNAFKAPEGRIFDEWNTKSDGSGISFVNGEAIKNLENTDHAIITLYAQWKLLQYEVTLDANGGTCEETRLVVSARYNNLPTPEKEGYIFKGWYSSRKGGKKAANDKLVVVKKDHTLYARWTPIKYTVSFDANGGTGKMGKKNCTYDKATKIAKNKFKNPGYAFVEWNTMEDGTGEAYANAVSIMNLTDENKGNVILYAQWELVYYTVTFDTNGGSAVEPQTIGYDFENKCFAYAVRPEDPVREGYTFAGWYSNKKLSSKYNFNKSVKKNMTLYAKWKPNSTK